MCVCVCVCVLRQHWGMYILNWIKKSKYSIYVHVSMCMHV